MNVVKAFLGFIGVAISVLLVMFIIIVFISAVGNFILASFR